MAVVIFCLFCLSYINAAVKVNFAFYTNNIIDKIPASVAPIEFFDE